MLEGEQLERVKDGLWNTWEKISADVFAFMEKSTGRPKINGTELCSVICGTDLVERHSGCSLEDVEEFRRLPRLEQELVAHQVFGNVDFEVERASKFV